MKSQFYLITGITTAFLCAPFSNKLQAQAVAEKSAAKEAEHQAAGNDHKKIANQSAPEAFFALQEGNKRFVDGQLNHPNQTVSRRTELAGGQTPFAIVLGCADSRTSPELIFDQGLGDLFVLRVAGNVLNDGIIGSIEYAASHFGTKLLVVLGHERCGAVDSARKLVSAKKKADGHVQSLINDIAPAVRETAGMDAAATEKANVLNMVKKLRASTPKLELSVVGAHYDLDTGAVEFLEKVSVEKADDGKMEFVKKTGEPK